MFFELIATFVAGAGTAGLVLIINMATGRRLPRWLMPVAAGLAMILYAIWSEYSWADRTVAELPEGMIVVHSLEDSVFYRPWTYVVPQVTQLMVLDSQTVRTNEAAEGMRLVDLYIFARWRPTSRLPQLINCAAAARADVTDAALAAPSGAAWITLGPDDPLIAEVCAPGS